MRVTCACPADLASSTLVDRLTSMGIEPIITSKVVRAVYDRPDRRLGEAIVELYQHEADHEIEVQYTEAEQRRQNRKTIRKAEKAAWNARLHGY